MSRFGVTVQPPRPAPVPRQPDGSHTTTPPARSGGELDPLAAILTRTPRPLGAAERGHPG